MSHPKRVVFLKQSGESLEQGEESAGWSAAGIANVVKNLSRVYKDREKLGIEGISLIPGAGNVARGDKLRKIGLENYADTVGRIGTIANAIVLEEALSNASIPTEVFITSRMGFWDPNIKPSAYNTDKVKEAYAEGRIVIIGGGAGENNATTDYAVVFYARDYKTTYDQEVIVLKGTKWDGIYEQDPAEAKKQGLPEPRRYSKISAHTMRGSYDQFRAVDRACLDQLIDGQLPMLVYQEDKHGLAEVLAQDSLNDTGAVIGTMIVPEVCEPVFHET